MKQAIVKNCKIILAFLILSSTCLIGQNFPYGFNYQAVVRDAIGNARTNTAVGLRLSVIKGSVSGATVYAETQSTVTNSMGQFNVTVGNGIPSLGTFSLIVWGNDAYFLKSEIQTGPSTFSQIGLQQLMSVPYALAAPDPTPPGIIQAYGGAVAPTGYLICDGAAVSRTLHAALFASIGTAYGAGDGTTTFNVPDLRGQFLRGLDGTASNDPDKLLRIASNPGGNTGNALGSKQADVFMSHSHSQQSATWPNAGTLYAPSSTGNAGSGLGPSAGISTMPSGGTETRPKNVYVNYIIKR